MTNKSIADRTKNDIGEPSLAPRWLHWLALLALCGAYIQGGIVKALDFNSAVAEMQHFGLSPAAPFAAAVLVLELGGSVLILAGRFRWQAALALGGFTAIANVMANRFWQMPATHDRFMAENGFFEHIGLVGGFLLVAWYDLRKREKHDQPVYW